MRIYYLDRLYRTYRDAAFALVALMLNDFCLFLFHNDSFSRAYMQAFFATNTFTFIHDNHYLRAFP